MGFILKVIIFLFLLSLVISIFEKVTGINITGDSEEEEEQEKMAKVLSPLEKELEKIKQGSYGRAKELVKYVITLYKEPYVEMGDSWSSVSIDTIVSKYLDNQLLFAEKYEDHVIDLEGTVETIGKNGDDVYISIGNDKYYRISGRSGESVNQLIECYLDKSDMDNENYKNLVVNMRPGAKVTLVGVLHKPNHYGPFKLYGTTLIEVNGVVPDRIMNIAVNSIYKKYESENDETEC
jgi:hypothetical protein